MKRNLLQVSSVKWSIYSIATALCLAAVAGFLLVSNWRILGKARDSVKYRQAAEVNLNNLSERENELKTKLGQLETDTGLDKEIRARFPVAKPGEEVIMIVSGGEATSGDSTSSSYSWWQSFLNFFKK